MAFSIVVMSYGSFLKIVLPYTTDGYNTAVIHFITTAFFPDFGAVEVALKLMLEMLNAE